MLEMTSEAKKALKEALKEHMEVIVNLATGVAKRNNKKEIGPEEIEQAVNTWEALKLIAQVESILTGGKPAKMASELLSFLEHQDK